MCSGLISAGRKLMCWLGEKSEVPSRSRIAFVQIVRREDEDDLEVSGYASVGPRGSIEARPPFAGQRL